MSQGSRPDRVADQIRGELAWQRLLARNVSPFINVSEEEILRTVQGWLTSTGSFLAKSGIHMEKRDIRGL